MIVHGYYDEMVLHNDWKAKVATADYPVRACFLIFASLPKVRVRLIGIPLWPSSSIR